MKKVLKICCGTWENASRDKRELKVCEELGCNVLVLAKGEQKVEEVVDGFRVMRHPTRLPNVILPEIIRQIASLFIWARYIKDIKPDIISGHDLSGLLIGWLYNCFEKKDDKAKLIYDSHELEIGRFSKRNRIIRLAIQKLEKFLIRKCEFTIVVNKGIEKILNEKYRPKNPIITIRSTPNKWEIDEAECEAQRQQYFKQLSISEDAFLLMFHGNLGEGNGIETMFKAAAFLDNVGIIYKGKTVSECVLNNISELSKQYPNVKYCIDSPCNVDDLWMYIGAVDLEIMDINPLSRSYYYSLPNKLFESIQAEIPMIVSDLPEMERIVYEYQIGRVCKNNDEEALAKTIKEIQKDTSEYNRMKRNIVLAKEELCWENEKKLLIQQYGALLRKISGGRN